MGKFGEELIKSLQQAARHAAGEKRSCACPKSSCRMSGRFAVPCGCPNTTSRQRIAFPSRP